MGDFFADVTGNDLNQILQIAAIAGVIFGIIICFRGYRLFRALLILAGFAIGMAIPAAAAYAEDGGEGLVGGIIVGIFTGLLGVVIVYALYRLAIVVGGGALGGLVGYIVATQGMNISTTNTDDIFPLLLIGGLIGAVLLTRFEVQIIKLLTAYGGAASAVFAGWMLANETVDLLQSPLKIPEQIPQTELPTLLVTVFILGTIGAAIQLSQQEVDKTKQAQLARQRQQQQQRQALQPKVAGRGALPAPIANAPQGVLMREYDIGDDQLMLRDPVEILLDIDDDPVDQPDSGEPVPQNIGLTDVFGQGEARASLRKQTRWIIIGNMVMWGAALVMNGGLLTSEQTTPLIAISILWVGMLIVRWMQYNGIYNIREADDEINLGGDTSLADLRS